MVVANPVCVADGDWAVTTREIRSLGKGEKHHVVPSCCCRVTEEAGTIRTGERDVHGGLVDDVGD